MGEYNSRWKGVMCECGAPVKTKGYCGRCYSYINRLGFLPKCNDCGAVTSKGVAYGDTKVYKCPECKEKVNQFIDDLHRALGV